MRLVSHLILLCLAQMDGGVANAGWTNGRGFCAHTWLCNGRKCHQGAHAQREWNRLATQCAFPRLLDPSPPRAAVCRSRAKDPHQEKKAVRGQRAGSERVSSGTGLSTVVSGRECLPSPPDPGTPLRRQHLLWRSAHNHCPEQTLRVTGRREGGGAGLAPQGGEKPHGHRDSPSIGWGHLHHPPAEGGLPWPLLPPLGARGTQTPKAYLLNAAYCT